MIHKNVRYERGKRTKFQNQYIRGIIHNLSLQRWTDQEIVYYLEREKDIEIERSSVSKIRKNIEKEAEKWYVELQRSRYKYIAVYKERIDSLFSYQKKLNQIIDRYLPPPPNTLTNTLTYPDTIIKAIAELHRIELSILGIFKALPHFNIDEIDEDLEQLESESELRARLSAPGGPPPLAQCPNCNKWFKDKVMLDVHECSVLGHTR